MTQSPQDSIAQPVLLVLLGKARSRAGTAGHLCASRSWGHTRLQPILAWRLLPRPHFLL